MAVESAEYQVHLQEQGDTAVQDGPPYQVHVEEEQLVEVVTPTARFLDFWSNSKRVSNGIEVTTTMQTPAVAGDGAIGRRYAVWHALDTLAAFSLDVELSVNARVGDEAVAFTLSGDAVEGTHYTITASPIVITAGTRTGTITVTPVATGDYHPERKLVITMDPGATTTLVASKETVNAGGGGDRTVVWLRSSTSPPEIDFNVPTSTPSPGDRASIVVDVLTGVSAHEDGIGVHVEAGGDAVEGEDYSFVLDPNGGVPIASGEGQRSVLIDILPGATTTREIVLTLNHERSDQSDQNHHATTSTFESQKVLTGPLGTEPSGRVYVKHYPDEARDESNASWSHGPGPLTPKPDNEALGNPLAWSLDPLQSDPWGGPLSRLIMEEEFYAPDRNEAIYYRPDGDGQRNSNSPQDTAQIRLPVYQRRSVYVTFATGKVPPRFVRIGTRERGFLFDPPHTKNDLDGAGYGIIFDREADTSALTEVDNVTRANSTTSYVAHATGNWAVWSIQNMVSVHGGTNSDFGVKKETLRFSDGFSREVIRLWYVLHVSDVVKTSPGNASTPLDHLVWFSTHDANTGTEHAFLQFYLPITSGGETSAEAAGTKASHWDKGMAWYWPLWETSGSLITGAPPDGSFYPRLQHYWEPRGGATIVPAGNNTHTITIT